MFNPGGITLAELSSALRDLGFVSALIVVGWKGRSWIQPGIDLMNDTKEFFKESRSFYTMMGNQMNSLMNNHLSHLKKAEDNSAGEVR